MTRSFLWLGIVACALGCGDSGGSGGSGGSGAGGDGGGGGAASTCPEGQICLDVERTGDAEGRFAVIWVRLDGANLADPTIAYQAPLAVTDSEVIKYSAAGFRDFTRIAASDPTMWRDVFLANKDATLDILGRFTEELFALQRAIRLGDGPHLHEYFTRTRAIRRGIIEAGQDTAAPDFGRIAEVRTDAKPVE